VLACASLLAILSVVPREAQAAQVATTWRGAQVHSLWASETSQQMTQDLDGVKQAGANVVRLDVAWATLDSSGPGQLTAWYSQKLAQFMAGARQRNLKVIAILFTTPCWASSAPASLKQNCQGDWWGRGVGWYPPTNDQDYAVFVKYMTSTYGSDLAAAEIWNEPDESYYWVSSNPASDYAQLLKAAYPAAKAGNSSVPVIAGAMSGFDADFLADLYQDGIQGSYDGISIHSYCDTSAPNAADSGGSRYEFEAGLHGLHAMQLVHGDNTSIWVTEFGWQTAGTPLQLQASYTARAYQIMAGMPYVSAGVVYELHDDSGVTTADPETQYGLLDQNYNPKPAYAAFQSVMSPPGGPVLTQPTSGGVVNGPRGTVSFSTAANSTVAVYLDGTLAGTASADAGGSATLTLPPGLADGPHSVGGVTTDPYGNVGPASSSVPFIVGPAAPVLVSPQSGAATGPQTTLAFTAAPGSKLAVSIDGSPAGVTTAGASGAATLTVALTTGPHSVSATATDSLGYTSPASAVTAFRVPPPAPVIVSPAGGTTSTASPVIHIAGEPGDSATVCVAGQPCLSAKLDSSGVVSVTTARLSSGTHTVQATQAKGQVASPASPTVTWTVVSPTNVPSRSTDPVASAASVARLQLRLARPRARRLALRCAVSASALAGCRVTAYAQGHPVGTGRVTVRRSGHRSATVRITLNALGRRYARRARRHAVYTFKASATMYGGYRLTTTRTARIATW
jgi:hypothetical protein